MIQTEKILERTRKLSRHEKKTILYRRDDVLCDLVTEGCYSGIPRDLLKECLVMYIGQDCGSMTCIMVMMSGACSRLTRPFAESVTVKTTTTLSC